MPPITQPRRAKRLNSPLPPNERINEITIVTKPALRATIRVMMIRRRTGWSTTFSASLVVKPVPVKAERA